MSTTTHHGSTKRGGTEVRPDPDTLRRELALFTGDLERHRHWSGRLIYTPGVHHLAESAGAYWLIDLVASWQAHPAVARKEFQVWTLHVHPDHTAAAVASDGNDVRLASQDIAFTDFPLDEISLWLIDGTLMLPGEY